MRNDGISLKENFMNPFFRPQLANAQHERLSRTATRLRLTTGASLTNATNPRARRDLAHRRRQRHTAAAATYQRCYEHICRRVSSEMAALPPDLQDSAFAFWLKTLSARDVPPRNAMTLRRVVRGELIPDSDSDSPGAESDSGPHRRAPIFDKSFVFTQESGADGFDRMNPPE
jgi:hypothetical protein